ncbi:TetR/AcrR family transcriptional regulator [Pelagibacterium sp. H642]|uniref:TetR/AcrR family transcriptional regulator n=1 Tax=Pelagibacterium sp. H642 TaxID=1881069 RepID=UPI0028150F63|nr:TetR/AcrR family transcriptional regulator [Pelagibacterium sp. H642]WMT91211.1 TetR/AcrR family transcriptional regulator [Pelagibacterium sp. H642]
MGRKQTIDRDALLDAAERVVMREGAGQLTIDGVAAEAGVSKGGVLYAFPTKDALIDAMFGRVFAAGDRIAEAVVARSGDTPEARISGHVEASRDAADTMTERSIALIVNFMRSPQYRASANEYYGKLLGQLDTSTPRGRKVRLALLAAEGAFLLRGFDFHPIGEDEWRDIHDDILDLLLR